jgi:transcriptional regulator with XRE-family HTH domain
MFGKRLAEERQRLGLSQEDLAAAWGIGRSGVAMIETERSPIYLERLIDLAPSGFDILYILSGEPAAVAAASLLNWRLLGEIRSGILRWAAAHHVTLPEEKEMLILKLLYQRFAPKGEVSGAELDQVLQLAA